MKGSHGEGLVFVVDDDESVRKSIESFIRSARLAVKAFARAINESALGLELQRLTERWSINDRWRCHFNSDNIPESKISSWVKHQLLRIVQEAIQNAARHANPTLIAITLRWRAPNLVLKVTDDGTGIPAHRLKNCDGFGLQNMRKRVQDMNGKFEMQTATGRGTSMIVTVPI
jgi:signal transduction histidine kinase